MLRQKDVIQSITSWLRASKDTLFGMLVTPSIENTQVWKPFQTWEATWFMTICTTWTIQTWTESCIEISTNDMWCVCFEWSNWKLIEKRFSFRWIHRSINVVDVYWCSMNHQTNYQITILNCDIVHGFSSLKSGKIVPDNGHNTVYSFPRGVRVKTIRITDKRFSSEVRCQMKAKRLQVLTITKTCILHATKCVFWKCMLDGKVTILFDSVCVDGKNGLICPRKSGRWAALSIELKGIQRRVCEYRLLPSVVV